MNRGQKTMKLWLSMTESESCQSSVPEETPILVCESQVAFHEEPVTFQGKRINHFIYSPNICDKIMREHKTLIHVGF